MARLKLKNKTWHLRMRVPERYAEVDPRIEIVRSLKTDSKTEALARIGTAEKLAYAELNAKLAGTWRKEDAKSHYKALAELAAAEGYQYKPASELAAGPLGELVGRIQDLARRDPNAKNAELTAAVAGGAERPKFMLSELFEEYQKQTRDKVRGKTDDQLRRWKNPRLKAIRNLKKLIGDKSLSEITRDDALALRDDWQDRIDAGEVSENSANKDLDHLSSMLKTVRRIHRLKDDKPFAELRLSEDKKTRPSLDSGWILEFLLFDNPLPFLDEEARDVLLIMVNTGARPSEILGLMPEDIHLDRNIPYIDLNEKNRKLKNKQSIRQIPLVGVSLEAVRRHPDGFPTYRFRDRWSDDVNRLMRRAGVYPSDRHTAYGLRHGFEDRMLEQDFPDRLAADLMGHKLQRERYGDGPPLEHKRRAVERIAL